MRAFETDHRVPSLGFLVVRIAKSGLAAEYKDCSREELLALKARSAYAPLLFVCCLRCVLPIRTFPVVMPFASSGAGQRR